MTISHLYKFIEHPNFLALNNVYSAITYTNRCFGFFAPTVGSDLKICMQMSDGKCSNQFSLSKDNFEVKTRIYSLGGNFAQDNSQSTMDLFAQSWGLKCLNENPSMNRVNILVMQNVIPTMKEFVAGKRITQDSIYITDVAVK